MSSVFISNVDDYLAPSQACVNPLFSDSAANNETTKKKEEQNGESAPTAAIVVPRRKRRIVKKKLENNTPAIPVTPAKVTMADCLACSGCVTTAETVLVEQHSLATLKDSVKKFQHQIVMTLSPASWADFVRRLNTMPSLDLKRKLTTFLNTTCRATVVLDGRVPLEWSLQEAAHEFCHSYKQRNVQPTNIPAPSIALSSTQIQYMNGKVENVEVSPHETNNGRIPMLTSSCPALVCLVEKSTPAAVPHLSTTKSPMSMAGAYFDSPQSFHVGIMPCHDKKLEASRKDLQNSDTNRDVDLVITTQELWTLLCETVQSENEVDVLCYLEGLAMAPVCKGVDGLASQHLGVLVVSPSTSDDVEMMDTDDEASLQQKHDFFAYGSGGYADYIFRFAARQLFQHQIQGPLPWTPVETTQARRVVSARVAASAKRKRDYYQVTLYQHSDKSYSCTRQSPQDVPVLRFATAYGLQNIQRVLQHAPFSTASNALPLSFDYVEAMACPSGCPNGGGQVRQPNVRETPTETRERVSRTSQVMKTDQGDCYNDGFTPVEYPGNLDPSSLEAKQRLHTRFHVVPPLQHTMGAAAGVAVQDTQW